LKRLTVTTDGLGVNCELNDGIETGLRYGVLTAPGLMVSAPADAASRAVERGRTAKSLAMA
jgi:hypothetical protein